MTVKRLVQIIAQITVNVIAESADANLDGRDQVIVAAKRQSGSA